MSATATHPPDLAYDETTPAKGHDLRGGRRGYDPSALVSQGTRVAERLGVGTFFGLVLAAMLVGFFWLTRMDQKEANTAQIAALNKLSERMEAQTKATEEGNKLLAKAVDSIEKGTDRMLSIASLQASQASVQAALNTQAQAQAAGALPPPPKRRR